MGHISTVGPSLNPPQSQFENFSHDTVPFNLLDNMSILKSMQYPTFTTKYQIILKGRSSILDVKLSVSCLLSGSRLDQLLDIFRQLSIGICSRATVYRSILQDLN